MQSYYTKILPRISRAFPVLISLIALWLSYLSYQISEKSELRQKEDIKVYSYGCCESSNIKLETSGNIPVEFYRTIEVLISNVSLINTSIVDCAVRSTGYFGAGISGSTCKSEDVDFFGSGGSQIQLPYSIDSGDVISLRFRDTHPISNKQKAAYASFLNSGHSDFFGYLCEKEIDLKNLASFIPTDSCIQSKGVRTSARSWISLYTGRGNEFNSRDLSQL